MTLAIIFLTYARTEYAVRTIRGVRQFLHYDGPVRWIVADDGSPDPAHLEAVRNELAGADVADCSSQREGYGARANWAWHSADTFTPFTLWLEDDWELRRDLDLTPYVNLLRTRDDVGVVRLGHLPIGLNLHSVGHDGRMYLHVQKNTQYAFSGNPHLKHSRMWQAGGYPTGMKPGDTEVAYDWQVRSNGGPAIWWPLAIGDAPYFGHIGTIQSYS